jgi:hypothetical protein
MHQHVNNNNNNNKNNVHWIGQGLKEDPQEGGIYHVGSSLRHSSMHELCLRHDEAEEDIIFLEVYSIFW